MSALTLLLRDLAAGDAVGPGVAERLSHELRTPLTTIYGGSKLLSRSGAPLPEATVREVSAAIEVEAERLKRLVEDLVVAALPPERAPRAEPVHLGHVLAAVVAQERLYAAGLRFATDIPDALPPVQGDESAIAQVVRNLLDNAARFGPAGGLVAVRAVDRGSVVAVQVADDGPGVAHEDEERVFEPFYRSPATATRAGLGLGLFVARRLVDAMGGTIRTFRRRGGGGGTEFQLPAVVVEDP